MKNLILILSACICLTACQKKRADVTHIYQHIRAVRNNSGIDSMRHEVSGQLFYNIAQHGNKTVFEYTNSSDILNANDAGYFSSIIFQADSGVNSFIYTDSELAQHTSYYTSGGAWSGNVPALLKQGFIQGEKIADGVWKVTIAVTLPYHDEYTNLTEVSEVALFTEQKP